LNKFSSLGLSKQVVEVLDKLEFVTPTPIQEQAIPVLLEQNPIDFIGLAQTGTGKTAAFGLPLLDLMDMDNDATQALIMAPTRELAQQTAQQLKDFSRNNRQLNVEVVYGGAAISSQIRALKRSTQIIVATPGRLLDLIRRKAVRLDQVRYVILDEADEMLNMGFKEDIDSILSHTPHERVTWLFSATMPNEIRKITKKYMFEPHEVSVMTEEKTNMDITHQYVITKVSNKITALRRFLDIQPEMRGILFCRTRRDTVQIADQLGSIGYVVEALNGDMSQDQRDKVMKRFKTRAMQLLIATDVAARGIAVNDLTHVLHHQLPDQLEAYTHRAGRTARAGKKGISLAFINPRETRRINELERKSKIKFEAVDIPSIEEMKSSRINHWADLIINTKVNDNAETILNDLHGQFAHLSKEDILIRLISTQLDHLMIQDRESANLNESRSNGRDDRSSRGESRDRNKRRKDPDLNRYFINLGTIDGVTKADLIHFLADVSQIDESDFGDISLQKNCAYFDVSSKKDKGFANKFNGIEIDDRSIRVNRDDDKNARRSKDSGGGKKKRFGDKKGGYKGGKGRPPKGRRDRKR
jgi:ATP-dependent RNA helicase DeaD